MLSKVRPLSRLIFKGNPLAKFSFKPAPTFSATFSHQLYHPRHFSSSSIPAAAASHPNSIVMVIQLEIKPEFDAEFLEIIRHDAIESRKEAGCMRFDVTSAGDGVYWLYEAYVD